MKEFKVAVGKRIFGIYKTKEQAIEVAQAASELYRNVPCRLVYTNESTYRGTPVFVNGLTITN